MNLLELMQRANKHYPDGHLAEYFNPETGTHQDKRPHVLRAPTLESFIVSELETTFDPGESDAHQVSVAMQSLATIQNDILTVMAGLLNLECWPG